MKTTKYPLHVAITLQELPKNEEQLHLDFPLLNYFLSMDD